MPHTDADRELAERAFGPAAQDTALAGRDVVTDNADVRLVYHDPDDGWWFSSGSDDEDEEMDVLCLPCLLNRQADLVEVADLPMNWIAERRDGGAWSARPRGTPARAGA